MDDVPQENPSRKAATRAESIAGLLSFAGWLTLALTLAIASVSGPRGGTAILVLAGGGLSVLLLFAVSAHLTTQAAILRELMKR